MSDLHKIQLNINKLEWAGGRAGYLNFFGEAVPRLVFEFAGSKRI